MELHEYVLSEAQILSRGFLYYRNNMDSKRPSPVGSEKPPAPSLGGPAGYFTIWFRGPWMGKNLQAVCQLWRSHKLLRPPVFQGRWSLERTTASVRGAFPVESLPALLRSSMSGKNMILVCVHNFPHCHSNQVFYAATTKQSRRNRFSLPPLDNCSAFEKKAHWFQMVQI